MKRSARWERLNDRRSQLIGKKACGEISPAESVELESLQRVASRRQRRFLRRQITALEQYMRARGFPVDERE